MGRLGQRKLPQGAFSLQSYPRVAKPDLEWMCRRFQLEESGREEAGAPTLWSPLWFAKVQYNRQRSHSQLPLSVSMLQGSNKRHDIAKQVLSKMLDGYNSWVDWTYIWPQWMGLPQLVSKQSLVRKILNQVSHLRGWSYHRIAQAVHHYYFQQDCQAWCRQQASSGTLRRSSSSF